MQLVYSACSPTRPGLLDAANHLILPPTILKPEPLYTGKQVCAHLDHRISTERTDDCLLFQHNALTIAVLTQCRNDCCFYTMLK